MPQRAQIDLKPAQETALAALRDGRIGELTRGAYQEMTGMSRSQAAYDIADLVEAGILERIGGGRSTRYRLVDQADGKRQWTSERIRAELERFCAGRAEWPSAGEFKANGRADLYVAASRYGGIGYWAAELGFPKSRGERRRPRRLVWGFAGAAAGVLLAGASAALIQHWPRGSAKPEAAPSRPATVVHRPRAHRATVSRPSARRRAAHSTIAHVSHPAARASTASDLVVRTVSRTVVRAPAATAPAGPTPLRAPTSAGGAPAPLPAPG